jgi:hypothetical protein
MAFGISRGLWILGQPVTQRQQDRLGTSSCIGAYVIAFLDPFFRHFLEAVFSEVRMQHRA